MLVFEQQYDWLIGALSVGCNCTYYITTIDYQMEPRYFDSGMDWTDGGVDWISYYIDQLEPIDPVGEDRSIQKLLPLFRNLF